MCAPVVSLQVNGTGIPNGFFNTNTIYYEYYKRPMSVYYKVEFRQPIGCILTADVFHFFYKMKYRATPNERV